MGVAQQFHFVEEYEAHVASLKARHSRDQAMRLAVGGDYEKMGDAQACFVVSLGLTNYMSLIDLGCGSGRTAKPLAKLRPQLRYLGIDIIQDLLDYAAEQVPRNFRFVLNRSLSIPAADATTDMVCAFSLFTHLLHEESFCYLEEAKRVLVPRGAVVFSFLDFEENWHLFGDMVRFAREGQKLPHMNMFMERSSIHTWSRMLGLDVETIKVGSDSPVGQSVAVLRKP